MASSAWPLNHRKGVIFCIGYLSVLRFLIYFRVCDFRQQLLQTLVACFDARRHWRLEDGIARFRGLILDSLRDRGLPALFNKSDRADSLTRIPGLVEFLSRNDALGRDDFAKNTSHSHFISAGVTPDIAVLAADSQIVSTEKFD